MKQNIEGMQVCDVVWPWRRKKTRGRKIGKKRPIIQASIVIVIAAIFAYLGHNFVAVFGAAVAVVILCSGLFFPKVYAKIDAGGKYLGHKVGVALSWLLLTPFFFIVIWPCSFFVKTRARKNFKKEFPSADDSCWIRRDTTTTIEHYKRQF